MNAVDVIVKNVDPIKLLEYYNAKGIKVHGDTVRCACPIHGGNNTTAFVYHLERKLWYCHTGCLTGGDCIELVQKIEGIEFKEAVNFLANLFVLDITNLEIIEKKNRFDKELKMFFNVAKKKEINEVTLDTSKVYKLKQYKDFKPETLEYFNVGYAKQLDKWYDRVYVPIYQFNKLVGCTLRTVKNEVPKWAHNPSNIETGNLLYNYDNCIGSSMIIVSEGVTDVWKWHEAGYSAVCTFGAKLSDMQANMLIRTGADICWAYDGDTAGQTAISKAIDKMRNKATMYKIVFDEGIDPGICTEEQLKEYYKNKIRVI